MVEACTSDTVPFRNDDWFLSDDGLEHRATGYFIAAPSLAARRGEDLWDWPLQMAEKRWCRPSLFREAFLAALDRFGLERDAGLGRSFALGFGIRAGSGDAAEGFVVLGDLLRTRAPAGAASPAPRRAAQVSARA
ncbi:hypothetical protein [uncultured Methylobacterium sp.]|uniref:hypothetical protein n=1 Tax=uncultured Methylobacterium sp. TaxID=157278 RepID=UPI0035CB939F